MQPHTNLDQAYVGKHIFCLFQFSAGRKHSGTGWAMWKSMLILHRADLQLLLVLLQRVAFLEGVQHILNCRAHSANILAAINLHMT